MTERWLDESRFQGQPDEAQVAASGITGIIWNDLDPSYVQRCQEVAAAGMKVGLYHYLSAGENPQQAGASLAAKAAALGVPVALVALDIEEGQGDQSGRALAFLSAVEAGGYPTPWVYTGGWFIPNRLTDPALARYPLWDAAYQSGEPQAPYPWTEIAMWQATSSAQVPGVLGSVDLDYLYHSPSGTSAPAPAPTPVPITASSRRRNSMYVISYGPWQGKSQSDVRSTPDGRVLQRFYDNGWSSDIEVMTGIVPGTIEYSETPGQIHVKALTSDGSIKHMFQTSDSGTWNAG